jgi:hypothetical protein
MATAPISGPFVAPALVAGGTATTAAGLATPVASGVTFGSLLSAGSTIYSVGSKVYDIYKSRQEKETGSVILQEPKVPGLAGGGGESEFDTAGSFKENPADSEKGGGLLFWGAVAVVLLAAS